MTAGPVNGGWERLEGLWEAAHALPATELQEFLKVLGTEDPAMCSELEALLASARRAERFFTRFAGVIETSAGEALMESRFDELQAGLAGRYYTLERELGRGGMATVYLARDLRHGREVALKVLEPELTVALGVDRFLREIEIVAGMRHPHILPLYDSGEAGSCLYYVMPYEPGHSLRERLVRDGPLPMDDAVRILHDVVDALAHAHEHGIVHCDIKPENILLSARHATVADFGVARAVAEASRSSADSMTSGTFGTPRYMAPEQAAGSDDVDHRADIYAVGVLAWEMLAGRPPFAGETPQAVRSAHMTQVPEPLTSQRPDVPEALAGLVMKCLEKRPADRWQRAEEILAQLETLRLSTTEARTGDPLPAALPSRRTSVKQGLVVAVTITAVAVLSGPLLRATRAWGRAHAPTPVPAAGVDRPRPSTTEPAAQELFRLATDQRSFRTDSAAREALARLQEAVTLDPAFAEAWAELALMYVRVAPREEPDMPVRERLGLAERHVRHALSLNDSLASTHRTLGNILLREYRFAEAEQRLLLAHRLGPDEASLESLVRLYVFTGRLQDALDVSRAAVTAKPSGSAVYAEYARAFLVNGRCDLALAQLERIANLDPPVGRARLVAAQCDALEGKWQDAIARFDDDPSIEGERMLGYVYARSGQRERALAILDRLRTNWESSGAFGVAMVYAGMRDFDQAFTWLHRSIDDLSLRWEIMEPIFDDLRADPRFGELSRRLGLQNR